MAIKCILVYKLPKGVSPTKADAERIVTVLTEQLCCIPVEHRGSQGDSRQLEAFVTVFKQQQVADLTVVREPKSLKDVWMYKLAREHSSKVVLMINPAPAGNTSRMTEADSSVRVFLEKRLDMRQKGVICIHSYSWTMGDKHSDVVVKLLQIAQQNQSPRCLAVEVTYTPAIALTAGQHVLYDIADRIIALVAAAGAPGTLEILQPDYSKMEGRGELELTYGAMHTVVAYHQVLTEVMGLR
eukprot:GHUV01005124.1.p1 GENE.GHUV01005124.1~~GHUV01005124.1.p1  ORF type:complete len:241 (+),score=56.98 GHUV01005124.1:364-1086(+)